MDHHSVTICVIYQNKTSQASHKSLIEIVACRVKAAGRIAKSNKFIDLASKLESDFIFKMKSTTDLNVHGQIRKGVS